MVHGKACILLCVSLLFTGSMVSAQSSEGQLYTDSNGILRWSADSSEIYGFGVNYTLPFAHEYRMAIHYGINTEEAVRQDVYHMARLDLDLYRVHVWDTEISDTVGTLLDNDHLRLFDFTLNEMKQRGMHFIITPIAYWGNGWPDRDEPTPGFSYKYGKAECLTNAGAIAAQVNYLRQFMDHVNPYTGIPYKYDPDIIGFEICNEPHHFQSPEEVTSFINTMVAAVRSTGCTKPLFYNMSHSIYLADAYLEADIQGGTFQWYPTNLVAGHQIRGNFLPHVSSYPIPFASDTAFRKMAKIIYEFDPADAGGNILYPAMAMAFRKAGMQLAAQFEYDAMFNASFNTNYGTHFMNMAYAPQKAISLKIASAVFHNVPLYNSVEGYNNHLTPHIDYQTDMTEWVTDSTFFYSNTTATIPPLSSSLKEIAGCGSSPVVQYDGTGIYFLDRLSEGLWRLELMPDACLIDDPYTFPGPVTQKAAVVHMKHELTVRLPDLGNAFLVIPVNEGNSYSPEVTDATMKIIPGVYLLSDVKRDASEYKDHIYKNIRVGEFVAPETDLTTTVVKNTTPELITCGVPFSLTFDLFTPYPEKKVAVIINDGDQIKRLDIPAQDSPSYSVDIPHEMLTAGFLWYRIMVDDGADTITFPVRWYNGDSNTVAFSLRLVPADSSLLLWDAAADWDNTYKIWSRTVNLLPDGTGETSLSIRFDSLPCNDPCDKADCSYAFKYYFREKIKGRLNDMSVKNYLVINASTALSAPQPLELSLVDSNGTVMAGELVITPGDNIAKIPLSSLAEGEFIVIPRPFPEFLPYKMMNNRLPFDWSSPETLQVVVRRGSLEKVDLRIEKIWIE